MAGYSYLPMNIDKYAGDYRRIVARSKWEIAYMQALDSSSLVKRWISEPKNLNISYINPLDRKLHQYWPDFLVQYVSGEIEIVEIKPMKEALAEKAASMYDKLSLIKNMAKWQAADRFAQSIGGRFRVITEAQLFAKKAAKLPKRAKMARKSRGTVK